MLDPKLKYRRFREYIPTVFGVTMTDQEFDDKVNTLGDAAEQCREMGRRYLKARPINPEYADHLFDLWITNQDETLNLLSAMQAIIDTPPTPQPGNWQPPTQSGFVTPQLPGPFFMSGLRTPNGLLCGTYRPARLYLYDGAYHEQWSGAVESVYMLHQTPSGPIFSTERPAGVWKKKDGKWQPMFERPEIDSLGFDIWPYKGGLLFYTASNVNRDQIRTYIGDANGENWRPYKDHLGWYMPQLCTDGQTYWMVGRKDRYPHVMREDGAKIISMSDYVDDEINYAGVKDGLFTFGMNYKDATIWKDPTKKHRNGYVMWGTTGGLYHSGIDCKPPFVMNIRIDPATGYRYAIASIWNESGYPSPELVMSRDGRTWVNLTSIPMPSVQTLEVADGGIYCYGGQYGQYGRVYFHKF